MSYLAPHKAFVAIISIHQNLRTNFKKTLETLLFKKTLKVKSCRAFTILICIPYIVGPNRNGHTLSLQVSHTMEEINCSMNYE